MARKQDIYIMTKKEYDEKHESNDKEKQSMSETLVNINTADSKMLMSLQGIGEAKAEAIIRYREEKGPFRTIKEIMNISGIKEAAFEKIKDDITVLELRPGRQKGGGITGWRFPRTEGSTVRETGRGGKMAKVLVVDDEKLIVKGIRFSLEQDGMEVDCA